MSESDDKAVFLSYASQDAEAARNIAEALRAAGVVVWFDKSELRGGDAWDQKIRKQIKECALFMPVISANTNARAEGYFRLEWKLAVDRSHLMADDAPFLFPVVIGDVTDATARVPDKFRDVQWTRVRLDESPAELAARVAKLLRGGGASLDDARGRAQGAPLQKTPARWRWWMIFPVIGTLMGLLFAVRPLIPSTRRSEPKPPPVAPAVSEARQLARRAAAMSVDKYNSTADDFATAEGLLKRALELEQNDAEIWAISSMLHTNIRTRGFDHDRARREWARRDAERAVKLDPGSQNALFALGRAQRDTAPVEAEATFKKLLTLNPDNADALGQLAWLYDGDGRVEEAVKLYDRVLQLDPARAPLTHYVRFLLFFHYSRFAEAEQAIRRSVELEPSANSCAGLVMLLLTAKGDAEESARVLAAVPEAFRNEPRIIWVEAIAQLCRRDPEAVLRALQRLQADYIQDNWFAGPKAYFAGLAHAMAGRTEAARVAWQSALAAVDARLKETPDNQTLHLCRGQLLAWLGETEEARREARLLDELRAGRTARSWFGSTALIHAAIGDADKTLPLLEQLLAVDQNTNVGWPLTRALLRLDPRWDKLRGDPRFQALCVEPAAPAAARTPAQELVEKARALLQGLEATREDFALAEDYCQRALRLDSTDGEVWAFYAQLHSAFGYRGWDTSPERREQNRVMAERAIRLAPDSVQAKLAQAGAWSAFGINRAETEKLLREVVAQQPDNQPALRFLAVTMLNQGKLNECLALNERSAALPGGDPLALFNNARYLWLRGRLDEAYAMMQRSLAQKPFSSSLTLKANMDIIWRSDPVAAEATLRLIPQSDLLEDRANYTAGLVYYYQRRADAALAAWGAFPRDYYADFAFDGPKGLLVGLAHELGQRDAAAKMEWRTALALVEKRIAATPNKPAPYYYQAYLLACLGEKTAAGEALRTYEQLANIKYTPQTPMAIELAYIYARLGRLDDLFAITPTYVRRMRIDPRFDGVRTDPRYVKLIAELEQNQANPLK